MVAPAGSVSRVRALRQCTRSACRNPAVATLTYVYADSTAVLGPLATAAEPHAYDLCESHAQRLTVPRGWQVVRLAVDHVPAEPTEDDISALADAVGGAAPPHPPAPSPPHPRPGRPAGRWGGWRWKPCPPNTPRKTSRQWPTRCGRPPAPPVPLRPPRNGGP